MLKIEINKAYISIYFQVALTILFTIFNGQFSIIKAQPFFFSSLSVEDGLPSSVTNSIVQDKHGFIWIGTQEGLCRFDGYKMNVFKNQVEPGSIPSNNISTLLNDGNIIWVGTWDGLCTINIHTFKIERINTGISRAIRALYKDNLGNIWIGTSNGLIIYNKGLDKYQYFDTSNSQISHNTVRAFCQAKNGDMWVGTYDKINRFRNNKFVSFSIKGQYKPWLKNNLICSILPYSKDNDSLLWVGTETGLCLFNTITESYIAYNSTNTNFSNEVIKCIYRQNDSTLWLGTDFGLNIFNTQSKNVTPYYHDPLVNNTLSNNVVWEIFADNKGRLWFITSNGISLLDNHQLLYQFHEEYYSLNYPKIGNQIRDILIEEDGKTWLASIYGVISHDPVTGETKKYTANSNTNQKILLNNVYALEKDNNGRIWIGTAGGINIWDKKLQKMFSISSNKQNGLLSNYINSFARQGDGSFWVSAWEGGLFKVVSGMDNPNEMKFMMIDTDGDGTVVNAGDQIFYGSHKELWIIDLMTFEKKPIEMVNKVLQNKEISGIIGDKNGDVWIGSENLLIQYSHKKKQIKKMEINTGFQKKLISLQKDIDGNIWASTYNSIIKIDMHGHGYFTIPIGRNYPLKSFYYHCATTAPNGNIFFGGDNGYIEIDPKTISTPKQAPNIYITALSINNQLVSAIDSTGIIKEDIAYTKSLVLKHNQNSFSFEFSTLDYLFPEVGQYAYRLKNLNSKWNYTPSGKNFAVYSNLSPGEYIFEVKGTDHFGKWSNPAMLFIQIEPPFWLSKGFIILYALIFVSLSYLTFKILKYRQKLNHELRITRLEKQHAEELFQSKQQFFTNISHEFRTPLSLILPPIQQVLKSGITDPTNRKLLKLANRNAQRLYKLVNQLLDFGKMESSKLSLKETRIELVSFCKLVHSSFKDMARRHEINYLFNSDLKALHTEVDIEKFEAILFNLLSNAFKYTPYGGSIELKIFNLTETNGQSFLSIQVEDSGIGIPENELGKIFDRFYQTSESKALNLGSGIGLTLAQEYVKLHNGQIKVESQQGKGSIFTISLPIKLGSNFSEENTEEFLLLADEKSPETIPNQVQAAKRILIIDDNEDILDYIEMNLVHQYSIYRASNGKDGLELTLKINPHLIISDIMMPIMDGIELCSKIKENQALAHIPVILLTAKTLDAQKTEGMITGADFYITKPFDIEYFKSCIESIFRREEQFLHYIKNELLLNPERKIASEKNQDEIFLKKVVSIIEKNMSDPDFSVEMISDAIGMSSTHLYRRLKLITNQSTMDIIKNYRMQKAAQMIGNNEGNITEIMYAVGFSSLSSFSKSFKSVFEVSPSLYAEKLGNENKNKG